MSISRVCFSPGQRARVFCAETGSPETAPTHMRRLRPAERSVPATRATTMLPAVVEPPRASASLRDTLASQAQQVLAALDAHGAVLLRGWSISSAAEFAEAMRVLPLPVCTDYFPAEPGRRPLGCAGDPLEGVWPTNSLRATGGYLAPEILPHSENYYALLPPRLVAFWCERAPWLGGETALFDGAGALAALPPALRAKLDAPFAVRRLLGEARLHRRHATQVAALLRASSGGAAAHHSRGCVVVRRLTAPRSSGDRREIQEIVELSFEKPAVLRAPPLAVVTERPPLAAQGDSCEAEAPAYAHLAYARPAALVLNFGESPGSQTLRLPLAVALAPTTTPALLSTLAPAQAPSPGSKLTLTHKP